jgi:hypothetical protein
LRKAKTFRPVLRDVKKTAILGLLILSGAFSPPAAQASDRLFRLIAPGGPPADRPGCAAFSLVSGPRRGEVPSSSPASVEAEMPKKTRRALLELGTLAVYSTIKYWADYHRWIEDWQYELTCADQYRRFLTTEAIRFDSNNFVTNWTHVIGGAVYYQFARTNYLTWQESLLASFVSSLFYEYISEWREVISVNDMFTTTFGAFSFGEAWFQLSDFFHHQRAPVFKALAFMNPANELNQWFDRKNPASKAYRQPGWHSFALSAGWRHSSETGRASFGTGLVNLATEIVRTPEYGRPGVFGKVLRDISLSELAIDVALRGRRAGDDHLRGGLSEEVNLFTRVVGLAWYRQNIDGLGRGDALSIGIGSAFTYVRKRPTLYDSTTVQVRIDPLPETPTDFRDKMAVTHLVGPVLDWTRFGRKLKLRVVADAYFDFALMNAFAFNAYSAVHSIEGLKTTLSYFGYHYALGASASGRADLDWGSFWLRGLASAHLWDSWEGLDRFQSDLTNDIKARDTRLRFLLNAGWRFRSVPVRLCAAVENIHRWGRVGDVSKGSRETRTFAGLSYLF